MRRITAFVVAALVSILSINLPATAADNTCNAAQSMCSVQPDTPIRLAADYSVKPSAAKVASQCQGKFGVALRKCKCQAQGESGFPCVFTPATSHVPEACSCQ